MVRVDKFILPTNFVVLDCEIDVEVPIILRRPLLATGKALVDVELGDLKSRVGGEEVTFKVCQTAKPPDECKVIGVLNDEGNNGGVDMEEDESEDDPQED